MATSPNWVSVSMQLGWSKPGLVDAGIPLQAATSNLAAGAVTPSVPIGTIAMFRDIGTSQLGTGAFMYLPGVTSTVAGDVVEVRTPNGSGLVQGDPNNGAATIRWTGTANTGAVLAVATAASNIQTTWGWYQVQGSAIVNVSGTVTAGQAPYFGQVATWETNAAVGGKQVLGARSVSASGVPDTGKAVFTLNNPVVQSQIT